MTRLSYATPLWLVAALAAATAGLAFLAAGGTRPERFLYGVPAVVAAAEALRSALLRPTLVADADGIEVVTGLRRERHPWTEVTAVAVMGTPEVARPRRWARALEIDLGERLILVPTYRLGEPVAQVAAAIAKLGAVVGTGGF